MGLPKWESQLQTEDNKLESGDMHSCERRALIGYDYDEGSVQFFHTIWKSSLAPKERRS